MLVVNGGLSPQASATSRALAWEEIHRGKGTYLASYEVRASKARGEH